MNTENLIPANEYCSSRGIEFSLIDSLKEFDLIEIITVKKNAYIDQKELPKLDQILNFHKELQLNLEGVDSLINLLERVHHIQKEVDVHRNRLLLDEDSKILK